jgi:hypothetical protein
MLVYKCDGESYIAGKKCTSEARDELPTTWLLISGKIKNGLRDAHYIETNGTRHFCSRKCLENFLFIDVKPAVKDSVTNTMKDPNTQTEQATQEANATESAAMDNATGASEGATEGEGTEG